MISTNRSCTKVLERNTASTAHPATLHQDPHSTRSFHVHDLQAYRVGFDKYLFSSLEIDQTTAKRRPCLCPRCVLGLFPHKFHN